MKAVFLDYGTMGPDLNLDPLRSIVTDLVIFDVTDAAEVADRIADADIVFTNKNRLTQDLLQRAAKLRFIGLTATGTDNIDLASAKRNGIAVSNIRAYCTQSVIEHVFGVLLTLSHSISRYHKSVRAGDWQHSDDFCPLLHPVRELSAMTLGIVGYGELGRGVARVARNFGMRVLVSARPGSNVVNEERVSFEHMLVESDVISLHCPLNDATRNLFGAHAFGRMKQDAVLINTARGGLVDSAALVHALENGDIGAAAIDVLPQEPPVNGDPLLEYAGCNLIVTPHIAWATDKARQNAIDELAANTRAFIDGQQRNRVV
jgi:glycerate dehydrogenase